MRADTTGTETSARWRLLVEGKAYWPVIALGCLFTSVSTGLEIYTFQTFFKTVEQLEACDKNDCWLVIVTPGLLVVLIAVCRTLAFIMMNYAGEHIVYRNSHIITPLLFCKMAKQNKRSYSYTVTTMYT